MSWNGANRPGPAAANAAAAWIRGTLLVLFLAVLVAAPSAALVLLEGGAVLPEHSRLWKFLARFHAVLLHLPIGFVGIALLLELWSMARPDPERARVTTFVLLLTAFSASIVASLGLMLATDGGFDETTLFRHKCLGLSFVALSVVAAGANTLTRRFPASRRLRRAYRAAFAAAVVTLVLTGHYGGHLTHGSRYLVRYAPDLLRSLAGDEPPLTADSAPAGERDAGAAGVEPILRAKCHRCHGPEKQKGGYRLDIAATALAGGESELPAIVPGDPLRSNLVRLILLPDDDPDAMPPQGKDRLTPAETLAIVHWIQTGASFFGAEPAGGETAAEAPPAAARDAGGAAAMPVAAAAETTGEAVAAADAGAGAAIATGTDGGVHTEESPAAAELDFARDVKPILEGRCLSCHDRKKRKGRLGLFDREAVLRGGKELGPAVVPGNAAASPVYARISTRPAADEDEELMPPADDGGPLGAREIEIIRRWIDAGAPWPEGLELAASEE